MADVLQNILSINRPVSFEGQDCIMECDKCGKNWIVVDECMSEEYFCNRREVMLHTLHHGSRSIFVRDFRCECSNLIAYDGMSDGLFCATRHHVFCRDLLDAWMFDVCAVGMSFRDAFASWKRKSCSSSAELIWVHQRPIVKRRMGNLAFNAFLRTVKFSKNSDLHDLFSCRTCKVIDSSGVERWTGVVMDGTATGILSKLPTFNRPICIVPRMKGTATDQYLMPPPVLREFTDSIFKSAKKNEGRLLFEVELNTTSIRQLFVLVDVFFNVTPLTREYACAYATKPLLIICYKVVRIEEDKGDRLQLIHLIKDQNIRRAIIEFGRCFISGSVCGGVLRRASSLIGGYRFLDAIRNIIQCSHAAPNTNVCTSCLSQLTYVARSHQDEIPSLSRLLFALINAHDFQDIDDLLLRSLMSSVSSILARCFAVRMEFSSIFHRKRSDASAEYTTLYKQPTSELIIPKDDWLDEASYTGELFPGNPVMRPNVSFGLSSRMENAAICKKNYRKSDSHSPGIFTVQCVCRYPKLIGLSVMKECESVSTAMSILLSRFKNLPRATYYDNACNLSKSVLLRFPWINDETLITLQKSQVQYSGRSRQLCELQQSSDIWS